MESLLNIPLEIWMDKIFPLLNPKDYLNIISTNKNNYKHLTNDHFNSTDKEETWKIFLNNEISQIKDYMNESHDSMMHFFPFEVSDDEWEDIVTETIYKRLQLKNLTINKKTTKIQSLNGKLRYFKQQLNSLPKQESLNLGNCCLLYDTLFVFFSFADPAFYPIKCESDLLLENIAKEIKQRENFDIKKVSLTISHVFDCFKMIQTKYAKDNKFFKERMRYIDDTQCISFYRTLLNYCSPFHSLDCISNENFTSLGVYLLTFVEKVLSLIYKEAFKKVSNLLIVENENGSFNLKIFIKIDGKIYEILINKFEWIFKEVINLNDLTKGINFLKSKLFDKFLFNSFTGNNLFFNKKSNNNLNIPNPFFLEYKMFIDLDFTKLKLYCQYTKYGYYTVSHLQDKSIEFVDIDKIYLVEKKKKFNNLQQKFLLFKTKDIDKNVLFSMEIGMVGKYSVLTKQMIESDYIKICDINYINLQFEGIHENIDFNQYLKIYLSYGCGISIYN